MSDLLPAHLIRNLRVPSGPRARLRVITLTHPLLDPGIAYWLGEEEASDA
ncbi:hypothetical protein ACFXPS_21180 [Nocardia sp. NPDC059091]